MDAPNSYGNLVTKTILSCKDFNIKEVNDLESIKSMIFNVEQYILITSLIKEQDWKNLKNLDDKTNSTNGFRQYLEIIKFFDQNKKAHIATIYDSDELWQDPQVIDIFPLIEK